VSPATRDAFLSETEIDRGARRVDRRRLPYRAELDQSGALLRALGAGVPAVVYDVGGLAEPVRAFGRAASSRRTTSTALARRSRAARRPDALARGAAGRCARARRAHLGRRRAGAPRPLPGAPVIFRRDRFGELIRRQLDLFAEDERELCARRRARSGVRRADREDAEEAYGTTSSCSRRSRTRSGAARHVRRDARRRHAEAYEQAFERAAEPRFRSPRREA
jgi:hypothetical protein